MHDCREVAVKLCYLKEDSHDSRTYDSERKKSKPDIVNQKTEQNPSHMILAAINQLKNAGKVSSTDPWHQCIWQKSRLKQVNTWLNLDSK